MNPTITYAITVCNEDWELKELLNTLHPYLQRGDQILIQSDSDSVTDGVLETIDRRISQYRGSDFKIEHQSIRLNKDFGSFKNKLKDGATGDWIFQIDADEYPTESLLTSLLYILKENDHAEVILVPRINTVAGITQEHINKWGWRHQKIEHPLLKGVMDIDDSTTMAVEFLKNADAVYEDNGSRVYYHKPVINFPDYQWRLYKNKKSIHWVNKVHERLVGYDYYATLPPDISWCLMHSKEIVRQESQNEFYDEIIDRK
jgi:hypothetical protein